MSGIFISYRRDDSLPWAGRLFDGLTRHFGKERVFMDINGGIPRGSNFEKVLDDALAGCDVLLALIGPKWTDCTRNGVRRLDAPDDWVRNEIATCLKRGAPVVPVLLGGTALPGQEQLPADLHELPKQQSAVLADADWKHHLGLLMRDVTRVSPLQLIRAVEDDDVESASSSIELLKGLLSTHPDVAEAVARSKEVVANTYERIGRLEMFKNIHDALHTIEFECFRPLQAAGGTAVRLRPFRSRFIAESARIRTALQQPGVAPNMVDDITERLDVIEAAFKSAIEQPGETATAGLIAELTTLLSVLPPRLDDGIATAARELNLDRLVALMTTVRAQVDAGGMTRPLTPGPSSTGATPDGNGAGDATLAGFVAGIDALQRLRDEVTLRVLEHAQLQRLDSKLRAVCQGGVAPGTLGAEWGRIAAVRARLKEPFTPELQNAIADLTDVEGEIAQKLAGTDEDDTLACIQEYFRLVADAFRNCDRALKDFCLRLGAVSQPLKTMLDLL
jgi:hypothetical protein